MKDSISPLLTNDMFHDSVTLKTKKLQPLNYSRSSLEAETKNTYVSATGGRRTLKFWLSEAVILTSNFSQKWLS